MTLTFLGIPDSLGDPPGLGIRLSLDVFSLGLGILLFMGFPCGDIISGSVSLVGVVATDFTLSLQLLSLSPFSTSIWDEEAELHVDEIIMLLSLALSVISDDRLLGSESSAVMESSIEEEVTFSVFVTVSIHHCQSQLDYCSHS